MAFFQSSHLLVDCRDASTDEFFLWLVLVKDHLRREEYRLIILFLNAFGLHLDSFVTIEGAIHSLLLELVFLLVGIRFLQKPHVSPSFPLT